MRRRRDYSWKAAFACFMLVFGGLIYMGACDGRYVTDCREVELKTGIWRATPESLTQFNHSLHERGEGLVLRAEDISLVIGDNRGFEWVIESDTLDQTGLARFITKRSGQYYREQHPLVCEVILGTGGTEMNCVDLYGGDLCLELMYGEPDAMQCLVFVRQVPK
jgi:hypothetical protein